MYSLFIIRTATCCSFHLHSFIDPFVYSQYITDSGCTASSLSELKQFLEKRQQIREQLTEDLKKKREMLLIIIMCKTKMYINTCTCHSVISWHEMQKNALMLSLISAGRKQYLYANTCTMFRYAWNYTCTCTCLLYYCTIFPFLCT